jgi:TRAP-type C4-dicarboxylate transport system substrate-binding protein
MNNAWIRRNIDMKHRIPMLAVTLVAMTVATGVHSRDLVYGSWVSPKHPVMSVALPHLFKGVAADTNGAVNWKMVAGGQLVNGRGTLAGLRDGIIDAGMSIPSYTPKALPATNSVFSSLVFGDDIVAAGGATAETVMLNCPQCLAEFRKNKTVFLGGYSASPFMLMCRDPIKNLAELQGKKVRSSGGGVYLMKLAGAVPVAMSPAQATTALQRGSIDCVLGAPSWLRSYGYQDVAKHIIQYPLGMVGPVLSMLINRGTWKKMTMDQKKAHLRYAPRVVAHSVITSYLLRDESILAAAKKVGVTLYPGGKEFDDLVARRQKVQRKQNVDNARKFGVKNPEAIADAFEAALVKWRKLSRDIGRDVGKYEAALKREVYDKLDINAL